MIPADPGAEQDGSMRGVVLIVEDHPELAETVGDFLEANGYAVDFAEDGLSAMHLAVTSQYDAIVLDVMLPGPDGLEVCRRLRRDAHLDVPIIMLTARDQLEDKIAGLDVGADDYLVKPFAMPELAVRLEALMRRRRGDVSPTTYRVADLELNTGTAEVRRAGQPVSLSRTLFTILRVLLRESPNVVSRQRLEQELWGDEPPDSDALRSHIYSLRRLVDRPFETQLIETVPGRGFRVVAPD
jgi:DNA-binding response OmpR family regulator